MHIQTQRLVLSTMTDKDLEPLVEVLTDPVVKQTYIVPDFENREAAQAMARQIQTLSNQGRVYIWGIYLDGQLIGMLNETGREEGSIEVGYVLLPQFHNRGYTTEAMAGVIQYLLTQGFAEVVAGAFEENLASIRVMIKCGMTPLDKQDEMEYRGKQHRCVYYRVGGNG